MDIVDLKNNQYVKDWFLNLEPTKNTEKSHLQGLKEYCNFLGKSPDQLINEALEDMDRKKIAVRRIKSEILLFRQNLTKNGASPSTVKIRVNSVKSFFRYNNVEIPFFGRHKRVNCLECHKQIPNKDDIRAALLHADKLERAIVLTGISSGLAEQEITNLKVSDFLKGYDEVTEITTLDLRRQKTNVDFITFLTPEATRAIQAYLDERNKAEPSTQKKKIDQQEKQKVFDEDGWLFIKRRISPKFLEDKNESHRKLSIDAIEKIYQELADRAELGIHEGAGRFGLIRSHNVRKLFNSILLNRGCDSFHTEFWMGHRLDDTKSAYFRANPIELRDMYQKFIPYLTIEKAEICNEATYTKLMDSLARNQVDKEVLEALQKHTMQLQNKVDVLLYDRKHNDSVEDWE